MKITRRLKAAVEAGVMDKASFMAEYGSIFEHSPWIADQVWESGTRVTGSKELLIAFGDVIRNASPEQQLTLLRRHPQLASGIAGEEELTVESRKEQLGAGLDRCSLAEFEEFNSLNSTYQSKFGFPFIMAVKGFSRAQILESFRTRLANDPDEEFREALEQVIRIGGFRLQAVVAEPGRVI
jgi:OHCU decarboxylase